MLDFTLVTLLGCSSGALPIVASEAPEPEVPTGPGDPVRIPALVEETVPPAPAGFDLAAELFGDEVVAFDIELSEPALAALRADPFAWVEGGLVYRGVHFAPVGVRIKGDHSLRSIDEKPSLKIQLDRYASWLDLLGLEALTLDNMVTDPSMMGERIAYRLFHENGIPASRANHATVRINGEDRGVYCLVETVDEEFLALRYADPTGPMWEFPDVDFADRYIGRFEAESGSDDLAVLQAIADALEAGGGVDAVAQWVDWEQFVDFVATTAVAGQFDSYPWRSPGDDVHVYFDPADGRMDTIPHGLDETFRRNNYDPFSGNGLLMQTCLASPTCTADYVASVWDALDTAERVDLLGYARDVQAQIAELAAADPERPYTLDEVDEAQTDLLDFIDTRTEHLSPFLGER